MMSHLGLANELIALRTCGIPDYLPSKTKILLLVLGIEERVFV